MTKACILDSNVAYYDQIC